MSRVKICGLTRETDLDAAVDAGADAVGVVADVPVETPREVSVERARELLAAAPPLVTSVLVTMPETVSAAAELVGRVEPDAVQVHGTLDADELGTLRDRTDADVIAAADAADPAAARRRADAADAVLVDSTADDGAGGTGHTHDWDRAAELVAELDTPFVLAGGLTPANVTEAVTTVRPFAVDVASGVEATGGEKDHDAVRAFVGAATGKRRVAR